MLELCLEKAVSVRESLLGGATPTAVAKQFDCKYDQQGPIAHTGYLLGIGRAPSVMGAAFALKAEGDVSEAIRYEGGAAVLKLKSMDSPDLTQFNAQRDSIYIAVKQAKQQQLYGRWFEKLMDESEIINNLRQSDPDDAS